MGFYNVQSLLFQKTLKIKILINLHCILLAISHWFNYMNHEDNRFPCPLRKVFHSGLILKLWWPWIQCECAIVRKKQCTLNLQTEMSRSENTLRECGLLLSFIHPVKILLIEGKVFRHEFKKIWLLCLINQCNQSIQKIIHLSPENTAKRWSQHKLGTSFRLTIENEIFCKKKKISETLTFSKRHPESIDYTAIRHLCIQDCTTRLLALFSVTK